VRELLSRLHFADENTMPPLNPEDLYLGDLEVHPRFFAFTQKTSILRPFFLFFFVLRSSRNRGPSFISLLYFSPYTSRFKKIPYS
jgi:hypothetical protein